jgi:hypothetical protein
MSATCVGRTRDPSDRSPPGEAVPVPPTVKLGYDPIIIPKTTLDERARFVLSQLTHRQPRPVIAIKKGGSRHPLAATAMRMC